MGAWSRAIGCGPDMLALRQKILLAFFQTNASRVSKADADRILFSGDHEDIIRSFRKALVQPNGY